MVLLNNREVWGGVMLWPKEADVKNAASVTLILDPYTRF